MSSFLDRAKAGFPPLWVPTQEAPRSIAGKEELRGWTRSRSIPASSLEPAENQIKKRISE